MLQADEHAADIDRRSLCSWGVVVVVAIAAVGLALNGLVLLYIGLALYGPALIAIGLALHGPALIYIYIYMSIYIYTDLYICYSQTSLLANSIGGVCEAGVLLSLLLLLLLGFPLMGLSF